MRRIINNKVYDTETAKRVGFWSNDYLYSDLQYESESLYQKKTGEFFIYGEGGPMSSYAVRRGVSEYAGSEKIFPATFEQAREWAEKNLTGEEYEALFGEVEESDEKHKLQLYVYSELVENTKRMAAKEGISISKFFENLIIEKME